jgi:hypothetical protein
MNKEDVFNNFYHHPMKKISILFYSILRMNSTPTIAQCCIMLLFILLNGNQLCAQQQNGTVRFNVYSSGYYNVSDYAGYSSGNSTHTLHIQLNGTYINIPNWSIKARVNGAILPNSGAQNIGGVPFPENKIKIQLNSDDGDSPTLLQIGAPLTPTPLSTATEAAIIPHSNAPLFLQSQYESYLQLRYKFEIHIEGGDYLDQMKNRSQYQHIVYSVPITYTLYNGSGVEIGTTNVTYSIQIPQNLTGTPPTSPQYGIEVIGMAKDGTLEFNTLASYINGVSVTYPDALKVTSNTAFEVTVKSRFNHFTNTTGDLLPVEILKLQLVAGSQAPANASYPNVTVSTQAKQIMYSQTGKNTPMFMDIIYSANGNDERLLNAKSGKYTNVLVYEILPK